MYVDYDITQGNTMNNRDLAEIVNPSLKDLWDQETMSNAVDAEQRLIKAKDARLERARKAGLDLALLTIKRQAD